MTENTRITAGFQRKMETTWGRIGVGGGIRSSNTSNGPSTWTGIGGGRGRRSVRFFGMSRALVFSFAPGFGLRPCSRKMSYSVSRCRRPVGRPPMTGVFRTTPRGRGIQIPQSGKCSTNTSRLCP